MRLVFAALAAFVVVGAAVAAAPVVTVDAGNVCANALG